MPVVLPPVIVLGVVAAAFLHFDDSGAPAEPSLDADVCPLDLSAVSGSSVFLFDLTKPIGEGRQDLPGQLLGQAIDALGRDEELAVHLLSASADAPRTPVGRLCKPAAVADLQVTTKDWSGLTARDCADLPAQMTPESRSAATRFCERRAEITARLGVAVPAGAGASELAAGAHLVEALEDIRIELAGRPRPQRLLVFSDMVQHAPWYSHLDLEWRRWSHADLVAAKAAQGWPPTLPFRRGRTSVEVFYLPRLGSTAEPRIGQAHRNFWREYFADADVTFHDQTVAPSYVATRLMDVPTEEEAAVAQARAEAERMLATARAEQERVRLAQERAAAEEARQRERQAELERQEEVVRQREAELARREELATTPVPDGTAGTAPGYEQGGPTGDAGAPATQASGLASRPAGVGAGGGGAPAVAVEAPPATERPCAIVLAPGSAGASPAYPQGGRMNYGGAQIAVAYVVDEQGQTVDEEVRLLAERSRVDRERYLSLFAEPALQTVRQWTFDFVETAECSRRQERTTSFIFTYE